MDDETERQQEIEALEAIYGDDFSRKGEDSFEITVTLEDDRVLVLCVTQPPEYPSSATVTCFMAEDEDALTAGLISVADEGIGAVVVFNLVQWITDDGMQLLPPPESGAVPRLPPEDEEVGQGDGEDGPEEEEVWDEDWTEEIARAIEESKKAGGGSGGIKKTGGGLTTTARERWREQIVSGEPLVDRKSTFQAHLAPVFSAEEVQEVVAALMENTKIARATHNILAFRVTTPSGNVLSDCDDDGESAAGGRLLHLLSIVGAENVCVVVSRWYGGIHLGPDRFKHINAVARQMLAAHGYIEGGGAASGGGKKKR